jgi:hypothetical protein
MTPLGGFRLSCQRLAAANQVARRLAPGSQLHSPEGYEPVQAPEDEQVMSRRITAAATAQQPRSDLTRASISRAAQVPHVVTAIGQPAAAGMSARDASGRSAAAARHPAARHLPTESPRTAAAAGLGWHQEVISNAPLHDTSLRGCFNFPVLGSAGRFGLRPASRHCDQQHQLRPAGNWPRRLQRRR